MNIVTSFYICNINHDNVNNRNKELIDSLNNNLNSSYVDKIHLYIDDNNALDLLTANFRDYINNKIIIIKIGKKPNYSDLFKYCFEYLENKICMITNSDIYIHKCDNKLLELLNINKDLVYALTRYEYNFSSNLIDNYMGSHDCFIFNSILDNKVRYENLLNNINFPQHYWGSENRLIYELKKINKIVLNPCKQIIIVHLHKSDVREDNRPRININGCNAFSHPIIIKI